MTVRKKPSSLTHHVPATYKRRKPDTSRPPSGVWYAVICNVNAEKKVRSALGGNVCGEDDAEQAAKSVQKAVQGQFMTYLPVRAMKQKVGGRRALEAVIERPLLPRYLFVASYSPAFPFFNLRGVTGVESIVRVDGRPMPIPHAVIKSLMMRDIEGEFVAKGIESEITLEDYGLSTGSSTKINEGIFEGLSCIVKALMPHAHAQVLVNIFGRITPVSVPIADLERVA